MMRGGLSSALHQGVTVNALTLGSAIPPPSPWEWNIAQSDAGMNYSGAQGSIQVLPFMPTSAHQSRDGGTGEGRCLDVKRALQSFKDLGQHT
mmetsp:Transcript_32465/g.58229  ORF Transcript_32465/g.58229 Transcript_32465/m.58229 type:complete len:92 (-) Transcript_32465:2901-3176(-)